MKPGDSPGDDDRRPHEGERRIGERLGGRLESTALHLHAPAAEVVAGSGRSRWQGLYRCPFCGAHHVAHARVLTDTLRRRSSCGRGVLLHAVVAADRRAA